MRSRLHKIVVFIFVVLYKIRVSSNQKFTKTGVKMKVSNLARILLTSKRHRSQRRHASILSRSLNELGESELSNNRLRKIEKKS